MTTNGSNGGIAAGVRWDLSDLYASVDDPRIDSDLDAAIESAAAFASEYRGRVGELTALDISKAIDTLETLQAPIVRAGAYSGLLFAADTSDPRHGALLQRVQEKATEFKTTLLFFELEWVALDANVTDPLLATSDLARRRHFLESTRRYKPHVLTEPEERILAETANTGRNAFSRLFDELMGSDVEPRKQFIEKNARYVKNLDV